MTFSKFFKAILCLLLSLCMIIPFCSCADAGSDEKSDTSAVADESDDGKVRDGLPALDYNNDPVKIISRNLAHWTEGEVSVEKENGEIVNDAIYNRELNVEDRLHIQIESELVDTASPEEVLTMVEKTIKSGDHVYNLCAAACYTTLTYALKGDFRNLRNCEYIDFSREYWSQGFNEVIEYEGAQFPIMGAIVLSQYRFAFATLFNKKAFTNANTPFLYDDVLNYEWTLDRQIQLVEALYKDLDGDGKLGKEDFAGLVTGNYISVDPYWSACEIDIIKRDEDGHYEYIFTSGRLNDVCVKLIDMFYNRGGTYIFEHTGADEEQTDIRKMFANGNAAMTTLRLLELETPEMRGMKDEYGVVPMPMFDTNQKQYHTLLHDQFTVYTVPSTANEEKLQQAGAVLEAMCSESYNNVTPAYYETALKYKYMTDPTSWEMLDIISENIYIDAGIIYTASLNSFHDAFRQIMISKKNNVTSRFKQLEKGTKKSLEKLDKKLCDVIAKDN